MLAWSFSIQSRNRQLLAQQVARALIALSALASRLRQPNLARPYGMPLWPLPPLVALTGVAVTVLLQTGRDLAIVAGILAAGLLYEVAYLRPRRDSHWILLDPPVDEPVSAIERRVR